MNFILVELFINI